MVSKKLFVIAGFVVAGFVVAGFVIAGFVSTFYCNSAGLRTVVRYSGVFAIAAFIIAGFHCTWKFFIPSTCPQINFSYK